MQRPTHPRRQLRGLLLLVALGCSAPALTKEGAHAHGLAKLDVVVDASTLTLQLEAPLDSLLGFEHRPRTAAQRQAADAVLKRVNDGATLVRPQAAALCTLTKTVVESSALQPEPSANSGGHGGKEDEHADLDARFEFTCEQPDKLTIIELHVFDAFKRIQKIEVQVAGAKGQSKQTLKRPDKVLRLRQ